MAQRPVEYTPNAGNTVGLCFIALLLPPLPVYLVRGVHADLLINFLLFLFGYLPGVIHAIYIVTKYANPKSTSEKTKYDITTRHAPSPAPETMRVPRPSTEPAATAPVTAVPDIQPFVAEVHVSGAQPPVQPAQGHHDVRPERDLPVYEEIASGSQVSRGDRKGE